MEYAELTRLASYGDTLHTARTNFWVMTNAVFLALLGTNVHGLSKGACWVLCLLGAGLCFLWWVTARRISIRLHSLNEHIKNDCLDSPHAFWLRRWKSKAEEAKEEEELEKSRWTKKIVKISRWCTTGRIFGCIVPALFFVAYLALLFVKLAGWTEDAPGNY